MRRSGIGMAVVLAATVGVALGVARGPAAADGQAPGGTAQAPGTPAHEHAPGTPPHEHAPAPVRMTMEELHRHGGVPPGWRLRVPPGDPRTGRDVFVKLECFKCHAVKGEHFPGVPTVSGDPGPELTGMGAHHPAEYVAESILNPDAVIVTGPGYTGPDGLSIMPDYRSSLTVGELIDLVAYVKGLGGAENQPHQHPTSPLRERVVGGLRVRLEYAAATATARASGGRATGEATRPVDHLMVFVSEVQSGEFVPYLPVSAIIEATGQPRRAVRLSPTIGAQGLHYGVDLTLPPRTTTITVAIGATTMRVMPGLAGRFSTPRRVSFPWSAEPPG